MRSEGSRECSSILSRKPKARPPAPNHLLRAEGSRECSSILSRGPTGAEPTPASLRSVHRRRTTFCEPKARPPAPNHLQRAEGSRDCCQRPCPPKAGWPLVAGQTPCHHFIFIFFIIIFFTPAPKGADESHFSRAPSAPSGRTGQPGSSTMALLSRSLPAQRGHGCRSISHPSPMSPLPTPHSPTPNPHERTSPGPDCEDCSLRGHGGGGGRGRPRMHAFRPRLRGFRWRGGTSFRCRSAGRRR